MGSLTFFAVIYGPEYEDITYYSDQETAFLALRACSVKSYGYQGGLLAEYVCTETNKTFRLVREYAYNHETGKPYVKVEHSL